MTPTTTPSVFLHPRLVLVTKVVSRVLEVDGSVMFDRDADRHFRSKTPTMVLARAMTYFLLAERYGMPLAEIGRTCGVHHTTVMDARKFMRRRMQESFELRDQVVRAKVALRTF